jgi:hypothetical protein
MSISTLWCVLMVAILLSAESSKCEERNQPRDAAAPVCQTIWSAGRERQRVASSRPSAVPGEDSLAAPVPNVISVARAEKLLDPPSLRSQKRLLESSLVNWIFYEDLSVEQRIVLDRAFFRCAESPVESAAGAILFDRFDASQRSTFVAATHAMLNTVITDENSGGETSDVLSLVEEMTDVHGENQSLPSDLQFQVFVRLVPDAMRRLRAAKNFEKGENHVFHLDYPWSFRQVRRFAVRGQEAGLHISIARDGHSAVIHIDYRFGILHLFPENSDVRKAGNHEKHVDRWPQAAIATRTAEVQRVVLHRRDTQQP